MADSLGFDQTLTGTAGSENKEAPNDPASAPSKDSQTASQFINSQLQLEAEAREALPYNFDHCTQPFGPLRQNLFSCLTCNPPPISASDPFTPAAVCYSCSIACHGEHNLVELFNRRNFTCDCGTTRLPSTSPCTLRIDPATGMKGPVHSQTPAEGNTYNHNCQNRFCGCGEIYDAVEEKGTMFQCLGLAGEKDGGCGEDWWHPECVVGLGRDWARARAQIKDEKTTSDGEGDEGDESGVHHPLPPRFPHEDDFDAFICYKCVDANPWIKRYAGSVGFLPPVHKSKAEGDSQTSSGQKEDALRRLTQYKASQIKAAEERSTSAEPAKNETKGTSASGPDHASLPQVPETLPSGDRKRSADDAELDSSHSSDAKRKKTCEPLPRYHEYLPNPPTGTFSIFMEEDFRENFCRCPDCYSQLSKHPQLFEEEDSYEPPLSESGGEGGESVGTGSLLDRGEAALSNVDRVRAIEGVMVYNHLKVKVKSFLQPFAESGEAVGAEDIKAYFEKLRGDEQGIRTTVVSGAGEDGDGGDNRRDQSGY